MDINFSLGRRERPPKKLTKPYVKELILETNLDEYTKTELLKVLDEFPGCSINQFYKNIHNIIAKIRENKK
jgi:hypothetical protein